MRHQLRNVHRFKSKLLTNQISMMLEAELIFLKTTEVQVQKPQISEDL